MWLRKIAQFAKPRNRSRRRSRSLGGNTALISIFAHQPESGAINRPRNLRRRRIQVKLHQHRDMSTPALNRLSATAGGLKDTRKLCPRQKACTESTSDCPPKALARRSLLRPPRQQISGLRSNCSRSLEDAY